MMTSGRSPCIIDDESFRDQRSLPFPDPAPTVKAAAELQITPHSEVAGDEDATAGSFAS
jgi:hypothetical protein